MAKLLFAKDKDLELTTFIHSVKADSDADYVCALNACKIVEISDEEYEDFFNGTKWLRVENGTHSFVDADDSEQVDESTFTTFYNNYKQRLEDKIEGQPNHSKLAEAQACLTFLNTIDASSRSYPSDHLDKVLKDNNTYVALSAF